MKTVRILISSPGDVRDERERARQIIEGLRRRYARHFLLKHVLWEDLPLQAGMSFQQGIDAIVSRDGGVDIGVVILWSRLGSPLGPAIRRMDGSEYFSGTEREFDLLMQAHAQSTSTNGKARPVVLVYVRRDDHGFHERLRGLSTLEQQELLQQKQRVEQFLQRECSDEVSGTNRRAHHAYDQSIAFSQRFRLHLQHLLDDLAEGEPRENTWDTNAQGPPFMGLEAFQERHADVFFGREDEILEGRSALREQARNGRAFLLLCGASGSGKSSLARAGILPAIVENEIDAQVASWRRMIVTPFDLAPDPIAAMVNRLSADDVLPELLGGVPVADVVDVLRRNPQDGCRLQLAAAFGRAAQRVSGGVRLILLIDQLEELFTTSAITARDRSALLSLVEAMAMSGSVWVVATVRADFYQHVQQDPSLTRLKAGRGQLDVLPPGADALRRIVEEPARHAGLRFEQRDGQSLADFILRDAAEHPELLPLVEDLLRELYERRVDDALTFAAYEALGNSVERVVARRAERAFEELPEDAKASLSTVLQAMVTLGQGGDDEADQYNIPASLTDDERAVRQRASLADFPAGTPARTLIDAFVAHRLFTTGQHPSTGDATISVAHESLLRVWPRAVAWAHGNRDFLRTRAHVAWRLKERSPLPEEDPLFAAARDQLQRNPQGFPKDLRAFIDASLQKAAESRRQAEAARVRRQRERYGLAALGVLALVASIVYFSQRRQQDAEAGRLVAVAGQLVAEAQRNLSLRDFARAEIAAAGALALHDTPGTRELLMHAKSGGVSLVARSGHTTPPAGFSAFSADGVLFAALLPEKQPRLVLSVGRTRDPNQSFQIPLPESALLLDSLAFSDESAGVRRLAAAWTDNAQPRGFHVAVWNLETGKPVSRVRELVIGGGGAEVLHTKRIPTLAFHPGQPWIATASEDQRISLWDLAGETPRLVWLKDKTHSTAVHGIAFNRTGSMLASAGGDFTVKIWSTADLYPRNQSAGTNRAPRHDVNQIHTLEGHGDSVFAVAFSPDDRLVASGGYDRTIRIWDLRLDQAPKPTPKHTRPVTVRTLSGHEGTVQSLIFSDDGHMLTSGSKDGTVRLWDVREGRQMTRLSPATGTIRSVASFNIEDGVYAGGDNGWSVWSVRQRSIIHRLWNGGSTINALAFDPSGDQLAAGGSDGRVRIWSRGQDFLRPRVLETGSAEESINGLAVSADGRWLAAGGNTNEIHVWDRRNDYRKVTAPEPLRHAGPVWGLCFDPSNRWLASSNTDDDKKIRLWNLTDWKMRSESDTLEDTAWSLACPPGGRWLVAGDSRAQITVRDTERLKDVAAKTTTVQQGETNVWSVAIADSPLSIISGNSDGHVRRWNAQDGRWITPGAELPSTTDISNAIVNSVSYSRKHQLIAAGGDGPSVELYDTQLGKRRSLQGHNGTVWFVSFDTAGTQLAYGGLDGILRVFDMDEMNRQLEASTPAQLLQEAEEKTGLTISGAMIQFK